MVIIGEIKAIVLIPLTILSECKKKIRKFERNELIEVEKYKDIDRVYVYKEDKYEYLLPECLLIKIS